MNKGKYFLSAYFAEDMADESGVTIMINMAYKESENVGEETVEHPNKMWREEECFEGGNCDLAEVICNEFNKLKTTKINDFYDVRSNVFKKHNFTLP